MAAGRLLTEKRDHFRSSVFKTSVKRCYHYLMRTESFSSDELFEWVKVQTALGPRRPGSPAGRANEDFLFSKLTQFGLSNVRREEVPLTHWEAGETSFSAAGKQIEAFGIPYTTFTGRQGIEAPLTWADPKSLRSHKDWRGRIVVTEISFPPLNPAMLRKLSLGENDPDGDLLEMNHPATWVRLGWHVYRWAIERGAVGFVGILKDQPGGSCRMYAPYGFREKNILDKPLPGVWVGREDGANLRRLAQRGESAQLVLRGTHKPAMSHNIVAEIPGEGNEIIVLSTHHDSPFVSAVEDASGVAVVLALARHLNAQSQRQRTVVIVFSSGHFYGSIGTRSFIARHREDLVGRTAFEISIEHIALEAREDGEGRLVATGRPEPVGLFMSLNRRLRDVMLQALSAHGHRRTVLLPAEGPLGNYPPTDGGDWYEAGVPVLNYISNPVYLLTDNDRLDWVDREALGRVAHVFADVIEKMDGVPREDISRVDFPWRLALMKGLRLLTSARTTCFGRRPVH